MGADRHFTQLAVSSGRKPLKYEIIVNWISLCATMQDMCVIQVEYGDHQQELLEVVRHLQQALPFADNDCQRATVQK